MSLAEATTGAVASPARGPGAAFRRPSLGHRYFLILLDERSRSVQLGVVHPSAREDMLLTNSAFVGVEHRVAPDMLLRIGAYDDLRHVLASGYVGHQVGPIAMVEWQRLAASIGTPIGLVMAFGAAEEGAPPSLAREAFAWSGVGLALVMVFSGASNVSFWMLLSALHADVTDLDARTHGERREGLFAGFASLVRKLSGAAAALGLGLGLTLIGYEEHALPSAAVVFRLKLLFAVPTTLLVFAALYLFRAYGDAEAVHAPAPLGANG